MDLRTQIALELYKALILSENFDINQDEAAFYAVRNTDLLLDLLSKPPGTINANNVDKKYELYTEAVELKDGVEALKERALEDVIKELEEEQKTKKSWF